MEIKMIRKMKLMLVLTAVFFLSLRTSWGQITSVTADQTPPIQHAGHDYIKLMAETVSPATGAVSVHIDVGSPAGRELGIPFSIGYDSNSARHSGGMDNAGYLAQGGWRYIVPLLQYHDSQRQLVQSGGSTATTCQSVDGYIFTDMEGTLHPLGINISPQGPNGLVQGCVESPASTWPQSIPQNTDGTVTATTGWNQWPFLGLSPPGVKVFNHDGLMYSFPNTKPHWQGKFYPTQLEQNDTNSNSPSGLPDFIETRNGNKLIFTDDDGNLLSSGAFHITDTLGRVAVSTSSFGSPSGDTISVSGLAQPFKLTWGTVSFNWTNSTNILVKPPMSTGW